MIRATADKSLEGAPGQQAVDGTASPPSYVNEFISSEDGLRLINAFMRITPPGFDAATTRVR
jgi:hypothetical protein